MEWRLLVPVVATLVVVCVGGSPDEGPVWSCPQVTNDHSSIWCRCDLPHTLRCAGVGSSVEGIAAALRHLPAHQSISLLDLSIQNLSRIAPSAFRSLDGLHGLVISSGQISHVAADAFDASLTALGLPNNQLVSVPTAALRSLVRLERLDLSNNRIGSIPDQLLSGMDQLRFLDLSGNLISALAPRAFSPAASLRVLHLRSNLLTADQLVPMGSALRKLQELDLGFNRIKGHLTSAFLAGLDNLVTLDLTANNLTLLERGVLGSLKRLKHLRLAHNQVGVIEDQAFVSLTRLVQLDLSHNQVVAISGQSLSHLNSLTELNLSHNYLRSLSVDLVSGLSQLATLDLDDNDISFVDLEAVQHLKQIGHFSLTDNPLNCDCQMEGLARWLRNNSKLSAANQQSAICATPPQLENAFLIDTPIETLTCSGDDGGDESLPPEISASAGSAANSAADRFLSSQPTEDFIRLSSAQVQFRSAQVVNSWTLETHWTVGASTLPYTCDAILVYELTEDQETLLQSYPVRCRSEVSGSGEQQSQLQLSVKLNDKMKSDRLYRLCLVLFERASDQEASLLPGCSHSMNWLTLSQSDSIRSDHSDEDVSWPEDDDDQSRRQITAFYANVTAPGAVSVFMRAEAASTTSMTLVVFSEQRLLAQKSVNCSVTSFTFDHLGVVGVVGVEYQVCVTFATDGQFLPPPLDGRREADGDIILTPDADGVRYAHCVVAKTPVRSWAFENTVVVTVIGVVFVLVAAALLVMSYALARRVFFRRNKLWSSSDTLSVPKATSRHILYVPESDYFTDSACSTPDGDACHAQTTSTNV